MGRSETRAEFLERADKAGIPRDAALRWWKERVQRTGFPSVPVLNQGREPASVGYGWVFQNTWPEDWTTEDEG